MPSRRIAALALIVVAAALAAGLLGVAVGRRYEASGLCCQVPTYRRSVLSFKETLGLAAFFSQVGQDKWVSETVFPGVKDGFFVDVGSGDGTVHSNTLLLERKGWRGICVDPFPSNMEGRTCQLFEEVVFSEPGRTVKFHVAQELGGIDSTLDAHRERAELAPAVELITVTLGDILARANAPPFVHFMSLDIEGAELEALHGVPFDRYRFGAFAIEHNYEGDKRKAIQKLLERHGYRLVHTWKQDDFYVPAGAPYPR